MARLAKTRPVPGPEITPKKRREPKTPPVIRLPQDLKARLQELAKERKTSLNDLCVNWLQYALKEYEKWNPPPKL